MKRIIYVLLSFFMALIIFTGGLCFVGGICTTSLYAKGIIVVSNYVNNAKTEIAESLKSVAIPSGLPENFFDDKIKTDFIKNTVNDSITCALNGKPYEMKEKELEALILEDLLIYAKDNGVEINEESKEMLKETARLSCEYYKNYTYNIFYRALKHIKGISAKLIIGFALLGAILAVMFYLLKGQKELSYALLSSGGMLIISAVLIVLNGAFKLAIKSVALLSFVNVYVGVALSTITILGVVSIIVSIKTIKKFIKE